ncbi:MFS transporter [Advenella sp. S44]|uniref:Tripartite tricarboxylate transporter substrate binding protein n=1 Tax=Advenella kashmirensis TaxID=310575 RepID=A0A356LC65_9BURK|nr:MULTISPECIES: tripartite tricarboxylate transporter substrate binding protein [unclassified Advenella]PJX20334.1 MFS transporter [Advenella sp. S44]HBP28151.1 tripartite tricarboxylate transporter substrate binding protein [Advenella kashmirensis]
MKHIKHQLTNLAAVLGLLAAPLTYAADAATDYPAKPVKLVVGYAPGGTTDISARLMADMLSKELGQPFIVENKPGANSNIGAEYVAKSKADGYTLLVGSISTAINPSLYSKLGYDPMKDFAAVGLLNIVPNIMAVNPKVPVKTVKEYIEYAKKNPDALTCASPGSGSSAHLGCELFKMKAGISILHVPYRGSGPAVADLLGGQVSSIFDNLPPLLPHVRSGKLTGLAVTTAERVPFAPEIPTIAESGVADFNVAAWFGILAPAETPPAIIEKVNVALNKALADPALIEKYSNNGFLMPTAPNTPASFKAFVQSEVNKWGEVVKATNLKID